MTPIEFTVVGTPVPGGSKRAYVNPKTGRANVVDASGDRVKGWRAAVVEAAMAVKPKDAPITSPVSVSMVFRLQRPKGHYGKRGLRRSAPGTPAKRPDVLKLARAVEDAVTDSGLWADDAQIVQEVLCKLYAELGEVPGVDVVVRDVDFG